jgi:hypothetical protein
VLNVFFLFFDIVFLNVISLGFDGIILIVQLEVLDFSVIDHACEFVFHFSILIVGRDGMCNDWILVFVEQAHDTHALVLVLFLFPE